MKRQRGYILVMCLLAIGSLVFFGSLYLDANLTMKRISAHECDALLAQAAADSGINDALAHLLVEATWSVGFAQVRLSNGATYSLSFDSGQSLFSTNNLAGGSAVSGCEGRTVPAGAVHLAALGTFGTAVRRAEGIFTVSAGNYQVLSQW